MIKRSQTRVTSHEDEAFRLLVDTMSEGAAILLSNGAISFGNLRFCEMLGMSSDRVISSPFHRFLSPEDQPLFNSLLKRSLTGGGNAEFTLLAGNGTTLPARLVVRPLTSSRGFCVVISDLTERRRSEEERSDRAAIVESPQDAIISKSAEGVIRTPLKNATGEVIGASAIGITGQKRAEEVLRRAGAYNRSLVEASLDPLVTISPDGKITDVNSATETITGSTRDELIGTDFCDYFTDPENARAGYQKVFREGLVRDYELEIRHRDGHTTPVLYNASVYRDEAGTIIGVFAAARDITQRKRAEAENAHLALIVNATDDAIFSTTPEGIIAAWNPGAERMLGYAAEEIKGKHFSLLIPEDRRPDLAANTEKLLRGEALLHYEHENQRKDGTRLQVLVTLSPVKDAKGAVTGVSVITRDITERKRREASLRESEERFRATFENAGIGMALVDMEGHPFKSNPVLDQMLGYGEEELRRMAFTEYTHPDDRESDWRLYGELKLGKRERYEIEKRFLKKGGGLLWGLLTVSLVRDSEGRPASRVRDRKTPPPAPSLKGRGRRADGEGAGTEADLSAQRDLRPGAPRLPRGPVRGRRRPAASAASGWRLLAASEAATHKRLGIARGIVRQRQHRLGQGAGLVEHHRVDLGQALQRGRRFQQHAGAEQAAGGDHLHRRHRQRQRAGAGDDQHGAGDQRRVHRRQADTPATTRRRWRRRRGAPPAHRGAPPGRPG